MYIVIFILSMEGSQRRSVGKKDNAVLDLPSRKSSMTGYQYGMATAVGGVGLCGRCEGR